MYLSDTKPRQIICDLGNRASKFSDMKTGDNEFEIARRDSTIVSGSESFYSGKKTLKVKINTLPASTDGPGSYLKKSCKVRCNSKLSRQSGRSTNSQHLISDQNSATDLIGHGSIDQFFNKDGIEENIATTNSSNKHSYSKKSRDSLFKKSKVTKLAYESSNSPDLKVPTNVMTASRSNIFQNQPSILVSAR